MRQEAGASSTMTSYHSYDVTKQSANKIKSLSPSWWGRGHGRDQGRWWAELRVISVAESFTFLYQTNFLCIYKKSVWKIFMSFRPKKESLSHTRARACVCDTKS